MTDNWYQYPTNYSNGTSVDGVGNAFFQYPNFILGGMFGLGILTIIFLTTFIVSLSSGSRKALLTSGFISTIFSIYFARLDLIQPVVVFVFIALTIIGAIGSKQENSL